MRRLKHLLYGAILLLGVAVTSCGDIVYDTRPCPPPSSHVYVIGTSRYYYPSGHPYHYRPAPPPPPRPKPAPHQPGRPSGSRPPIRR